MEMGFFMGVGRIIRYWFFVRFGFVYKFFLKIWLVNLVKRN